MIAVGQTVGNYRVTAKLGEGGMGVVYLAEHPVIGRKVALKAIHPELSKNPEVISRFMTEAKSVNQIGNEHIVDISDFGNTPEGEFYFVMEFLQGESLADRLRREHRFPAPRALKIAAQVADALAASHAHGIIHRDLKPENIYLITRGANVDFVKVLDFGLAKLTQGEEKVSHKTRTGSVMGTPYYMSPEQCEGRATVDHRADIYSLGVILFEMFTGKVPFGGEGYGEIIVKHITQPAPSPLAINPELQPEHEALLFRALAKAPADRFQEMAEFRAAMLDPAAYAREAPALPTSAVGAGQGALARSGSDSSPGAIAQPMPTTFNHGSGEIDDGLPASRSRKGILVAGVAAALAVVAGGFALLGGDKPETEGPASAVAPADTTPATVNIAFRSDPIGATVVIKDTGEVLGLTPLDKQIPFGHQRIEFAFRLDGYQERVLALVPDMAAKLAAALDRVERPSPPPPAIVPPADSRKPPAKPVVGKKPDKQPEKPDKPAKPRRPHLLDEDAVLEPSFD